MPEIGTRDAARPGKSKPALRPVARPFALPGVRVLRELRRELALGGLPPKTRRSPEDNARIAVFRMLEELLPLLDQYRRRIEAGEHCCLVEREHGREKGRLLLEFVIESNPKPASGT